MNKIFECIVGSHAYGTNIETSDIDIKGVFLQPLDDILGFKYKEQINVDKDTTYYEVKRFLELLSSGNPTMLEMLFVDERFIKHTTPIFERIVEHKHKFLTQNCFNSFGGYAVSQIKKAKGLNKKMNWEKSKTIRKTPIDFCYVFCDGRSKPITKWLEECGYTQEFVGLAAVDHMPNCYAVYIDIQGMYGAGLNVPIEPLGYKGIISEDSNSVKLSSIPKGSVCHNVMYYNQDAYSIHCKEYREYTEWLNNRNTQRYVDTQNHNQQIDGKNLMHCMRLLDCALEIAENNHFNVFRPNAEYLIDIRKGKYNLDDILFQAEEKLEKLNKLKETTNLPKDVDQEFLNSLLCEIRKK